MAEPVWARRELETWAQVQIAAPTQMPLRPWRVERPVLPVAQPERDVSRRRFWRRFRFNLDRRYWGFGEEFISERFF